VSRNRTGNELASVAHSLASKTRGYQLYVAIIAAAKELPAGPPAPQSAQTAAAPAAAPAAKTA
jgi:hypothetical protein